MSTFTNILFFNIGKNINKMKYILVILFLVIVKESASATTHSHQPQKSKERLQDGLQHAHDTEHHHTEFDHEAILGSVKDAEEFHDLPPEEAKRRLAILVKKMDLNKDGFVDRHELKAWILRSFKSLAVEEASDRFEDCDEDGDHKVTWAEYLKDTYGMDADDPSLDNNEIYEDAQDKLVSDDKDLFKAADIDGDGLLILDEYLRFNNPEEHPDMLPILLKHALDDKDMNNDGKIDFQEFVGDSAREKDKEFLVIEKDKFDNDFDKDQDGFLKGNEILSWMIPSSE